MACSSPKKRAVSNLLALVDQSEGPDPRDGNQVYKLEGEAAPKATEALRKGADAARGRGRRKGRLYQRTGARN
jgi:hypothetical protein